MYQWHQNTHRIIACILICCQFNLIFAVSAQGSTGWDPSVNSYICGKDVTGDRKWLANGEGEICDQGSIYDPFKAYKADAQRAGYIDDVASCPIDSVSCNKSHIYYCPIDDSVCKGTTCQKQHACKSTQWYKSVTVWYRNYSWDNQYTITNPCDPVRDEFVCSKGGEPFQWIDACYLGSPACRTLSTPYVYRCNDTKIEYSTWYQAYLGCRKQVTTTVLKHGWDCPLTYRNDKYTNKNSCLRNCIEIKKCSKQKKFDCPLGNEYSCINLNLNPNSSNNNNKTDNFVCSKVNCGAYSDNNTKSPVNRDIYVDDGQRSTTGECLDDIMIFGGRAMDCRQPGISSAYQNCCDKSDGEIYHDSMGSIFETYHYMETISVTYTAAVAAYEAYQSGATAAEAGNAATEVFAGAFDPTTLAITVAIMLIMNYLEKACPPQDIETAILNASNYCIDIGEKCTKKWFGVCVQEVEVKCCFNSMLAKIIHEQGRPQLGMRWGTANAPACQGFTPEQFQSLDFSKIDLSEYYDELQHKNQSEMQSDLESTINTKVKTKVNSKVSAEIKGA